MHRKGDHFLFRQKRGVEPFKSSDPDTERIWWNEVGVNQNMTFPVQPDPISGMHCWHQKVTVSAGHGGDRYADIMVDTSRSAEVYEEWLKRTRPAPGPDGLRRPLWLNRPLHPAPEAYQMTGLDSTIIVGLMQQLASEPVRTFSIGFSVPEFDETRICFYS